MESKEETKTQQPQQPERIDYDAMWGVSGYYNDDEGNDIRDRD